MEDMRHQSVLLCKQDLRLNIELLSYHYVYLTCKRVVCNGNRFHGGIPAVKIDAAAAYVSPGDRTYIMGVMNITNHIHRIQNTNKAYRIRNTYGAKTTILA